MKGVDTIARIRREFFVRGKSIKEIVREQHVSRNTVRKVLRSGASAFTYEREVQPLPKLGRWKAELDRLLASNASKARRERLTLMRVYEALRELGYEGGYDAVRRYARSWYREQSAAAVNAYVPLSFDPGEAYQFDWSHEIVLINGTTVTVKVAHVRLCHSRMLFVRAYPRETQEMVFDAHDRAFAFFKGTCRRGIYDLAAVLVDGLPAVEAACAEALDQGVHSADVILNILARRRDVAAPTTILTPAALRLRHMPVADCDRYDRLRRPPWTAPISST
jgi:transposase